MSRTFPETSVSQHHTFPLTISCKKRYSDVYWSGNIIERPEELKKFALVILKMMNSEIEEDNDRLKTFRSHPFAEIFYSSGISWSNGEFEKLLENYFGEDSGYTKVYDKIKSPYEFSTLISNYDPFYRVQYKDVLFDQLEYQSDVGEDGNGLCFITLCKGVLDSFYYEYNTYDHFTSQNLI